MYCMKFRYGEKFKSNFILRHPFVWPVSLICFFVLSTLTAYVAFSGVTVGSQDTHIVKVSADNLNRDVPTRAKTVGELIKALNITMSDTDKIEPSVDAPILEDNQRIVIYRSRPVIVVDGERKYEITSAERDPKAVVAAAGLTLSPKDLATIQASDESLTNGIAAEKIKIFRAIQITTNIYGEIAQHETQAKTVSEFLKENNIVLKDGESTQPENSDATITAGMLLSVNAKGTKTVSTAEPVAFSVETKTDSSLAPGQSKVLSAGVLGERSAIYIVSYDGDKEVGRRLLSTVITRAPINEVRAKASFLPSSYSVDGEKQALMAAAGIPPEYYGAADYIISHESHWRPGAVNSSSGAYGLCQALPASKMASAGADYLTNPVTQLVWCSGYANGRYGSWGGAYQAWQAQRWW